MGFILIEEIIMKPNGIAKALRTPMYRQRIVKAKKGKGSYSRKGRHDVY
jgi:alternative ribosome-rescue factor